MTNPKDRKALEDALAADPDDRAAHAAYADWLMEQGDPRGEFIQVQLALEEEGRPAAERKRFQKREKELLNAHQREWIGNLATHYRLTPNPFGGTFPNMEFGWARGWLHRLHIYRMTQPTIPTVRALFANSSLGLLRELNIYSSFEAPPRRRAAALPNLRRFQLGNEPEEDEYIAFQGSPSGATIVNFIRCLPRLEELYLYAQDVPAGDLFALNNFGRLRVLLLYHSSEAPLEILAANSSLSQLTHLLIHPRSMREPCLRLEHLQALLRSPYLKSLTHLRLRMSNFGDPGCREIVDSGILRRLKHLDLRHGVVTNQGARILAACPDLQRLEHLDLDRNALTEVGIRTLRGVCESLQADNQQSRAELNRRAYLLEGEFE